MDDDWARCDAQAAVAALSARYRFSLANAVQLLRDAGSLRQREHDDEDEEVEAAEEEEEEEEDAFALRNLTS